MAVVARVWLALERLAAAQRSNTEVHGVFGEALVLDRSRRPLLHLGVTTHAVLLSQLRSGDLLMVTLLARRPVGVAHVAVLSGDTLRRPMVLDPPCRMRHDGHVAPLA